MPIFLPILPYVPEERTQRRVRDFLSSLSDYVKRVSGVARDAGQKHPGEVLGKFAEGMLFGVPKALWEMGVGTGHLISTASKVASTGLPPTDRVLHAIDLADQLTNGFFTAAPQYFESFLQEHPDIVTPTQRAVALGHWLMFEAPIDFLAHSFGSIAEETVRRIERGDASGAVSSLIQGGLFAASLIGPSTGARSFRRIVERKAITHDWVSLPEFAAAKERRQAEIERLRAEAEAKRKEAEARKNALKDQNAPQTPPPPQTPEQKILSALDEGAGGEGLPEGQTLSVAEIVRRTLPLTEALSADSYRRLVRTIIADDMANHIFFGPLFHALMEEEGHRISYALSELMTKRPKMFEDVVVAALEIDPNIAPDFIKEYGRAISSTAHEAGSFLEVSSELANYIKGMGVAEHAILDALKEIHPEPPGTARLAWQWLSSRFKELAEDVVVQAAEAKAALRRGKALNKEQRRVFILNELADKIPPDMADYFSGDPSLNLFVRHRGGNLKVITKEQAIALAEKIRNGELPDIDMPQLVLAEEPFPGVPLAEIPQALRAAVGRLRRYHTRGASSGKYIADVVDDIEVFERYSAVAEALTDDEILRHGLKDERAKLQLTTTNLANRIWSLVETARGGLGLANPRTAIRDVTNTFLMSIASFGDAVMTALVDSVLPGPAPTMHALMEVVGQSLSIPKIMETWERAHALLELVPEAKERLKSSAIPIELLETIKAHHFVHNKLEAAVAEHVGKAVAYANAFRTLSDRMIRSVIFSEALVYELAKHGLRSERGVHIIDNAMELLMAADPEWTPRIKEALYEATRRAAELSMADTPVSGNLIRRAISSKKIREALESSLEMPIEVRWWDTASIAHATLELFRKAPFLRTLITMYPRFWINVWQTVLSHHPGNIIALFNPRFRRMLFSDDPAIRAQAVEHIGKGLMGAFTLTSAFYIYRNHSMGKPYLIEIPHDDGTFEKIDTRMYKPFDVYLSLAAVFDYMLTGRRPNLNANEYFDLITGLRRMTDQPFSALYPYLEQMAAGNEDMILHKMFAQFYSPLLTPLAVISETTQALVGLFDPEVRERMYEQADVATSPLVGPMARVDRDVADWLSQSVIGGDPHFAIPTKVDPYTGGPARSSTRPYLFYLTGLAAERVPALERAFLKAGVDPIAAIDPTIRSTPYANLYRKLLGMLVTSPVSDPTMPDDIARAQLSAFTRRSVVSMPELVKMTGLSRENLAKHGRADIRIAETDVYLRDMPKIAGGVVKYLQEVFVRPAYRADTKEFMRQHRTVGDLAAAIIMDDRIVERFRLKSPVSGEQIPFEAARTLVAKKVAEALNAKIGQSVSLFDELIRIHAPWVDVERMYRNMPPELRHVTQQGLVRPAAQMEPRKLIELMEKVKMADDPLLAPKVLGGGK